MKFNYQFRCIKKKAWLYDFKLKRELKFFSYLPDLRIFKRLEGNGKIILPLCHLMRKQFKI